jgi:hypothetical protein
MLDQRIPTVWFEALSPGFEVAGFSSLTLGSLLNIPLSISIRLNRTAKAIKLLFLCWLSPSSKRPPAIVIGSSAYRFVRLANLQAFARSASSSSRFPRSSFGCSLWAAGSSFWLWLVPKWQMWAESGFNPMIILNQHYYCWGSWFIVRVAAFHYCANGRCHWVFILGVIVFPGAHWLAWWGHRLPSWMFRFPAWVHFRTWIG